MEIPDRTYPPRLREIQAKEEAERRAAERRRKRIILLILVPLLLLVLFPLVYGLFDRHIFTSDQAGGPSTEELIVGEDERIQVSVQNACGAEGVAKQFSNFLRARRFDVLEYGNADENRPVSTIIDRVGDTLAARKVAYALGIQPSNVKTDIDSSLYVTTSVIVGEDYASLRPMQ